MLDSDVKHPNLGQVWRDFCSARQAYAQTQQEEVTEERDPNPNPKKHLEYEVSQGELLGKTHCLSVHLMLLRSQYSTVPTDDIKDP